MDNRLTLLRGIKGRFGSISLVAGVVRFRCVSDTSRQRRRARSRTVGQQATCPVWPLQRREDPHNLLSAAITRIFLQAAIVGVHMNKAIGPVSLAFGLAFWLASDRIAFAQAGSTGGTIGKTDKSVSGGEEATLSPSARPSTRDVKNPSAIAPSIAGQWRWTADCSDGSHFHGVFDLSPTSGGQFTGEFISNDIANVGAIEGGHATGSSISFTRRHPIEIQHWEGRLQGGHIEGSPLSTGWHGTCQWQANRR
jgi:hypothetical protein